MEAGTFHGKRRNDLLNISKLELRTLKRPQTKLYQVKELLTLQTHFNYEPNFDFEDFKAQAIEQLKAEFPYQVRTAYWHHCWRICWTEPWMDKWTDIWKAVNASSATAATAIWANRFINGRRDHKRTLYRDGTFAPQVVRKRENILADSMAGLIIGLYAIGDSTKEISDILEE